MLSIGYIFLLSFLFLIVYTAIYLLNCAFVYSVKHHDKKPLYCSYKKIHRQFYLLFITLRYAKRNDLKYWEQIGKGVSSCFN